MFIKVFIDEERNIFQVYHIVFARDFILSFALKPYLSPLLKYGHLQMTLELKLQT